MASNGHTGWRGYTFRQMALFYGLGHERLKTDRASSIIDTNMAFNGGDAANAHIEDLMDGRE